MAKAPATNDNSLYEPAFATVATSWFTSLASTASDSEIGKIVKIPDSLEGVSNVSQVVVSSDGYGVKVIPVGIPVRSVESVGCSSVRCVDGIFVSEDGTSGSDDGSGGKH